jgi:hypothetical protein
MVYWLGPIIGAIAAALLWEFGILNTQQNAAQESSSGRNKNAA